MAKRSPTGKKTPWEKEKLLVTSNFSLSHSVLKRLVLKTRKNKGLMSTEDIFSMAESNLFHLKFDKEHFI